MEKIKTIKLAKVFDKQISGRSAVNAVFSELNGVHHLILDFSDIQFISRSAAHQLISCVERAQQERISVETPFQSQSVSEMLQKVKISIKNPKKLATYVEFLTFSSEKEMDDFLLSY